MREEAQGYYRSKKTMCIYTLVDVFSGVLTSPGNVDVTLPGGTGETYSHPALIELILKG